MAGKIPKPLGKQTAQDPLSKLGYNAAGVEARLAGKAPEVVGSAGALEAVAPLETGIGKAANAMVMIPFIGVPVANGVIKAAEKLGHGHRVAGLKDALEEMTKPISGAAATGEAIAEKAVKQTFMEKMKAAPAAISTKTKAFIANPKEFFAAKPRGPLTKLDHLSNVGFAVTSGVSTYGVVKSGAQQLDMLKHAIADMKGVDVANISTAQALFGSVPKSLEAARSHLIKEHAIRGVAQLGGLVAMVMTVRAKKHVNNAAWLAPMFVDMGANALLGESVLPAYAEIKNAYNQGKSMGQPVPAEMYAKFLMEASKEVSKRGVVGQMVAMKAGEQYAAENMDPGKILAEIDNGAFNKRIAGLIATAEAEHTQQVAAAKAAKEAAATQAAANAGKKDRAVVGAHTQRIAAQTPATHSIT
jgi:hypothetical protein